MQLRLQAHPVGVQITVLDRQRPSVAVAATDAAAAAISAPAAAAAAAAERPPAAVLRLVLAEGLKHAFALRPWRPLSGQAAAAALCLRPRCASAFAPPPLAPPLAPPLVPPSAPLLAPPSARLLAPLLPALLQPLLASSSVELEHAVARAWRDHAAARGAGEGEEARAPPRLPAAAGRDELCWRRLLLLSTDPADADMLCASLHRLLEALPSPRAAAEVDVLCAGRVLAASPLALQAASVAQLVDLAAALGGHVPRHPLLAAALARGHPALPACTAVLHPSPGAASAWLAAVRTAPVSALRLSLHAVWRRVLHRALPTTLHEARGTRTRDVLHTHRATP